MIKPKQFIAILFIVMMSTLGGCSENSAEHNHMHAADNVSMEPIKVELSWSPEQGKVNEPVSFKAVVTQAGEAVDDAKEVLFEIVNTNDGSIKLELKGTSSGSGTYEAEGSFAQEGEYSVTSHVTARTQHSMPSKELTVLP
ncbi:FixH family protein [Paenibacillus tianjinensis]|uniref:FixH family protein n=1 Tax=Paenibacillus tianjinensis TaxID=2810347 RepID=A0ABX7L5Z2_9BACL|nr:FixH family protein [Paenibacillus tianjinensis]QSF42631.1 FixH family protein [Paenibacillus tianjinensis]